MLHDLYHLSCKQLYILIENNLFLIFKIIKCKQQEDKERDHIDPLCHLVCLIVIQILMVFVF